MSFLGTVTPTDSFDHLQDNLELAIHARELLKQSVTHPVNPRPPGVENSLTKVETLEWLVMRCLQEHNFSFVSKPLAALEAALISENGYRRIVFADDLSAARRVYLCFHMLGHVAHDHIDREALSIIYELRDRSALCYHQHIQELAADIWVDSLLTTLLASDRSASQALAHALHRVQEKYEGNWSVWRYALHRLAPHLYQRFSWLWRMRQLTPVTRVIPRLYYLLDVLPPRQHLHLGPRIHAALRERVCHIDPRPRLFFAEQLDQYFQKELHVRYGSRDTDNATTSLAPSSAETRD